MFNKSSLIKIHRTLGVVLSVVMLAISVTGTLLIWKKEFIWLSLDKVTYLNTSQSDALTLSNSIDQIESTYVADELRFIQLFSEDLPIHKTFLSDRRYAWHDHHGQQIEKWASNERFEDWLLDLHHRFLLGNKVGLQIAGFSGLFLMPLLLIGFIIWWSRRSSLRLGFYPKSSARGFLIISHGNLGAVFLVPIFLLSLTGVILVYPTESRSILLESINQNPPPIIQNGRYDSSQGLISWEEAIAMVYQRFPNAKIRSVTPSNSENMARTVAFQQVGGWHRLGRSVMKFHRDGRLEIRDEFQQALAKRVFGFSYPLHTAKLGLLYKLVLSLIGLAFVAMSLFGLLSYLKRFQNNAKHRH